MGTPHRLRLLRGGREASDPLAVNELELVLAEAAPKTVQATVQEEDTFMVLGADPVVRAPQDHPIRVMTGAFTFEPLQPGSVVERSGAPRGLLAVIHDLDQEPSCRDEWVASALDGILDACGRHRIEALSTPLLGTVHHVLPMRRAAGLMVQALRGGRAPACLRRIWICAPGDALPVVRGWLLHALEQD